MNELLKHVPRFRVWDVNNKKFDKTHKFYIDYAGRLVTPYKDGLRIFGDAEYIASQYTGRRDQMGDRIFEGDILRMSHGAPIPYGEFYVVRNMIEFLVFFVPDCASTPCDNKRPYIVAGNVFDNPELLEKTK